MFPGFWQSRKREDEAVAVCNLWTSPIRTDHLLRIHVSNKENRHAKHWKIVKVYGKHMPGDGYDPARPSLPNEEIYPQAALLS